MENNTQIQTTKQDREVSFRVFGSDENIRLSIAIVRATLVKPTRSGKLPSDADIIKFMMLCKAKGLNPYENDAYLVGYDGKNGAEFSLISSIQSLLKRAEVNPNFGGLQSGAIVREDAGAIRDREGDFLYPDDELLGGWAMVFFKDNRKPSIARINIENFRKPTPFWDGNPAGMIVKCAEADALRMAFPTKLGGLYIAQEMARIERGESINVESVVAPQDIKTLADKRETAQAAWREAGKQVRGEAPKAIEQPPVEVQTDEQELADAGLAPEQPKSEPTRSTTSHDTLAGILDQNKITFDQLKEWAQETGQTWRLGNGDPVTYDALSSLDDIPEKIVKKWIGLAKVIVSGIKAVQQGGLL